MLYLAAILPLCSSTFIDNLAPRLDNKGAIMDSHDFAIHKVPGTPGYIMVSIAYGLCEEPAAKGCDQTSTHCGFQPNHTINVWTSPDLSSGSWELLTTAVSLANRPPGTIFRPDFIWNPHSQSIVLWFNWLNAVGVCAFFFFCGPLAPRPRPAPPPHPRPPRPAR